MTKASVPPDQVRFFSGSSNRPLAGKIAEELGVPLDDTHITRFSNDNMYIQLGDTVRYRRVYIVQSLSQPVNDHLMELLIIIDALPLNGLADSLLLSSVTGHVMFVIEAGKTRTKAAVEALRMLGGSGTHIIGATLTKSTEDMGGYGYKAYGYGSLDRKRNEILMIPHEAEH